MAKKITTINLVVKVKIEYDENLEREDAIDEVQSNMNYEMTYKTDNIEIIETEILGDVSDF